MPFEGGLAFGMMQGIAWALLGTMTQGVILLPTLLHSGHKGVPLALATAGLIAPTYAPRGIEPAFELGDARCGP